jgi:diguanylate cyclase (GGDEF)-like protein/PAS domain S-box-containing protein
MLGYSSEDFHHYKDFMTLVHPDDYDNAMNAMRKYFAGQTDKYETDYRILTKSNGYKWFHDAGSIIKKDSKGLPLKIAGIVIDITEHKRLDALRQEALNRLEKIASLVPGLVYQYRLRPDGSSCFPFASEAINEVYRVSPEEVREDASKVFANLHPDDLDGVAASIQASAQDLSPWQHEYRVKFEDGTIRFLYGSAVPQREEDGSTLWHGFIADITERKRAEERISQLANELQGTLDTVTAGISHLKDRKVEWANAAHDEIFGYSIGETRGMETSALYPDRASFERLGQEAYPQLMAGKTYDTEIEMQKKDGTHIWCSLTGHMMNVSQPADGSIWMIQDISERKQTEEALRESERFAHATVDAIAGEITILDETGVIIEVNRAWRALAMTEASVPVAVCEGANYLAVCDATRGPDAVYAKAIGNGIRTVISGKQTVFSLEYPCEFSVGSRTEKHWFNAKVTRFAGDGPIRIVVAHENITARKHAEESLQQQNIYLSTLHQITLDLLNHRNMDELLQTIVDRAVILLDAPFGELMLEKDGELIVQTCTQNQASLVGERNGRAKAKLSWLAFDTKQPVVLEDYSTYEYHESIYTEYALCAVAEFPILVRDKCIGVLSLGRVKPEYIFTEMQVKNGSLFAQLVALVLDNAQLFSAAEHEIAERKQIEADLRLAKETLDSAHQKLGQSFVREQTLARTDTLTGINNRRFLFEIAEREFNVAMRYRPPLSMLMFDIDHFKHINDTFGHSMGDHVLQQVTQVVCAEVRSADVIGRYGGDEFVILLPQTDTQESLPLAERIHASVATIRIPTDKDPLVVTISLGIAQTSHGASQPDTVENLFLRADQALYSAKQAGRNCTRIFEINSK